MNELKGRLIELHIEDVSCYGVIFLDEKIKNGYFPFVTASKELTDKIRKGNGHYILRGGFYNDGGSTFRDSEIRFYTVEVEELVE